MSATPNRSRIRSLARGYERAAQETEADVVLLNTCSVRDMAEQKALGKMGMLGQIAKRRPEVVFGFLGCMAQARGDALFAESAAPGSRGRHAEISSRRGLRGGAAWRKSGRGGWMIRVFPSAIRTRRPAPRKPFAITSCRAGRRRRSFPSCRAATCIAPFASCRRRAARSAAARSRKSCAKCASSSRAG